MEKLCRRHSTCIISLTLHVGSPRWALRSPRGNKRRTGRSSNMTKLTQVIRKRADIFQPSFIRLWNLCSFPWVTHATMSPPKVGIYLYHTRVPELTIDLTPIWDVFIVTWDHLHIPRETTTSSHMHISIMLCMSSLLLPHWPLPVPPRPCAPSFVHVSTCLECVPSISTTLLTPVYPSGLCQGSFPIVPGQTRPPCSRAELSNLGTAAIWGPIILWCGVHPVRYGKSATLTGARSIHFSVMIPEAVPRHCQMILESKVTPGWESLIYSFLESLSVPWKHWPQCVNMCLPVSLFDHFVYLTMSPTKAGVELASSHPCIPGIQDSTLAQSGIPRKIHTFWICT